MYTIGQLAFKRFNNKELSFKAGDAILGLSKVAEKGEVATAEFLVPPTALPTVARRNGIIKDDLPNASIKEAVIPVDIMQAADEILRRAETYGVVLKLIGGLAFKKACPSSNGKFLRENKDIDLVGRHEDVREIKKLMEELDYKPREMFNKLSMNRRFIYYDLQNKRRVEIFIDEIEMCHRLNLRHSLEGPGDTVLLADLIATKLQIVLAIDDDDFKDLLGAFYDKALTEDESGINKKTIVELTSNDWGVWKTFTTNLSKLKEKAKEISPDEAKFIERKVDELLAEIERPKRSLGWRMRAKIGEKARWYQIPEETGDPMLEELA